MGIPSVLSLIQWHAAKRPDQLCLFSIDENRGFTWVELLQEVRRLASVFAGNKLQPGDRVGVVAENSLELATLYCAVLAYGAVFCPISCAQPEHQIQRLLTRLRPRLVFREDAAAASMVLAAASKNERFESDAEGHAAICFTSGTTDGAKAVAHTFESYYLNALETVTRWGLMPSDRVLDFRSFTWAATHTVGLHPLIVGGHSLVFARGFRVQELAQWVRNHRPTVLVGIPTVIDAMIDQGDALDPTHFSSLRFVSCSTAPLTSERHKRFEDRFGVPLVQLYGMSEGGLIALNPHDRRRIGSVGLPSSAQRLRIFGSKATDLRQGEVGQIMAGGPACASHYVLEDGALAPIAREELATGDMGRLDEDGYLYVLGRTAQAFNRNGHQILPFLIDQSLVAAPPVKDAASMGRDGRIISFVVRKESASAEEVMAHCGRTLPAEYLPDEIVFCDEIPRNARGKVDFEKLGRA